MTINFTINPFLAGVICTLLAVFVALIIWGYVCHRKQKKRGTTKQFLCMKCDCEFKRDKDEYRTDPHSSAVVYIAECPVCSNTAIETFPRHDNNSG